MGTTIVVGAQYGSEGKGALVQAEAHKFDIHVRVGAPNAGHSIVVGGKLFKMQIIPCGWCNPSALLVLGRGALINLSLLRRELADVSAVDASVADRLRIDPLAGILEDRHHQEEGGIDGEGHKRIGSTGEGVGAARLDRVRRDPRSFRLARDCANEDVNGRPLWSYFQPDTPKLFRTDRSVLVEGTQGSGLSLIHGQWPYVTSNDTNASQIAADCGIPPLGVSAVWLVVRTYPIRVAGTSGPLRNETTWEAITLSRGQRTIEHTTVTRKVRRVGLFDWERLDAAVVLNRPTAVAITFMDYLYPELTGCFSDECLSSSARDFVGRVERACNAPVRWLGTGWGENGWSYIRLSGGDK